MNNEIDDSKIESFFNFGGPRKETIQKEAVILAKETVPAKLDTISKAPSVAIDNKKIVEPDQDHSGMTYVGQVPNIPTRKFYPERTFDKYVKKDARLEEEDLELLKQWTNGIAHFKRKKGLNNGSSNRITDNTIIRILLSEFCDRLSMSIGQESSKEMFDEETLRDYIVKVMGRDIVNEKT